MDEVIISLSVDELDCLKRMVKEKIAIWQVRIDCANCEFVKEHCRIELALYESLLKSLNN